MAKGREIVKVDKITGAAVARYKGIAHAINENPDDFLNYYGMLGHAKFKRLHFSRYVYRYLDTYNPNESFTDQKVNVPLRLTKAYCDGALMCVYAYNRADIAKALNRDVSSISDALRRDTPIAGWYVRRLEHMGDLDRETLRRGYIVVWNGVYLCREKLVANNGGLNNER